MATTRRQSKDCVHAQLLKWQEERKKKVHTEGTQSIHIAKAKPHSADWVKMKRRK